jgi:hypothetical protein
MNFSRLSIAEELLGHALGPGGIAPCPGRERHTHGNGARDFRVTLDGAPTGFCYHQSCSDEVAAFNKELRRRIWFAENSGRAAPRGHWGAEVAPEPRSETKKRPDLDRELIATVIRGVPAIDEAWLRGRSRVDVAGMKSGAFLDHLFTADEKVLIFTSQMSQGDFAWWRGHGGFRLAKERGVSAVKSALPTGAPEGVWFLVQPVTGQWAINNKAVAHGGEARWTRRSECNVTAWRYYVLESDELDTETWLRIVVNLPLPIAAIYTSGKRSIHALVKWPENSKAQWDAARDVIRQVVCPLGADPAALTAVRLSRLPGCKRGGQMQQLLYLNPEPKQEAIRLLPALR